MKAVFYYAGANNTELIALKAIFNVAVKWGYLRQNPARGVKALREIKGKTPRFLSKKEINILLKHAPPDFKPILQTFLYTGLRKAELVNLEWSDINFNRNVIQVRAKEHWQPKSNEREIPLHPELKKVLKKLKDEAKGKLVFTTRNGNSHTKVRERFIKLTKECDMEDVTKVLNLTDFFKRLLVAAQVL
jgi:integrase